MWRVLILLLPGMAQAESLVAARVIRANEVVAATDVMVVEAEIEGAATALDQVVGMEVKVAVYPGRPLLRKDLGPPTLIERNQLVSLVYQADRLAIHTEGRALGRGGSGDVIQVINLSSRATLTGRIGGDGIVYVTPRQ